MIICDGAILLRHDEFSLVMKMTESVESKESKEKKTRKLKLNGMLRKELA